MDRPDQHTALPPAAASSDWMNDPLWYKDAIVYELHVKAFFDSDGDGIGDFRGLTDKLDYLSDLGVNTLWLLPFYPSPQKDDGYDISDYRNVHASYGTRADVKNFIREAHRRGLKVITKLVVNHTSDQHPWFQAARRAPKGSAKRDFYVWSDTALKFPETRIIFTDSEKSNWAWDDVAKAYYWHRFFSHQPDLNHNNPEVVKAVIRVMRFWLDCGVDGLRLDAIPYLCVREGTHNENLPETHDVIKRIRKVIDANYTNRMLLAEANQWPEDVREYFGDADECHMAYHFPLMPRMYMALAQEDRHPIVEIMRQTPEIPHSCQWAIFLRNHDELTLEMVTNNERDYMYRMYAGDPRMRVNVGIRRRLAPLLDNDRGKIELMCFLLMTMPGSPILYYGDELGMGDNFYLGDRNGVRTPMQWSSDRNGGFSRADPQQLFLPPIMDAIYGYGSVNVESQTRSPSSLLNWTKRLIAVRKSFKAFGRGSIRFLEPGNRKILAYLREYENEVLLCVANLSRTAQPVELNLGGHKGRVPVELMGRATFPPIGDLPYLLTLPGHGHLAFRLADDADVPVWHEERLARPELPVLVLVEGWRTFIGGGGASDVRRAMSTRTRKQLQNEVLAPYMQSKRWFAAKGQTIEHIDLIEQQEWHTPDGSWLLTIVEVRCKGIDPQLYFLPMSVSWDDDEKEDRIAALAPWTLAKVRQRDRVGILYGSFGDERFCRALVNAMGKKENLPFGNGRLVCSSTAAFAALADGISEPVRHPGLEQSNTAVLFGERLFLKGYRRLQAGTSPEVEAGAFLTERSPYDHIVPVAGAAEIVRADGKHYTLCLLQSYVENQGSGWDYAVEYLERYFGDFLADHHTADGHAHSAFMRQMFTLGQRTAELHLAFAKVTGDEAFDPQPASDDDVAGWIRRVASDLDTTIDVLVQRGSSMPEANEAIARRLMVQRAAAHAAVEALGFTGASFSLTRLHGDYHLGQVLLRQDDFVITDFEGEPSRSLDERRAKQSPLRDVAGMLRSLSYAAAVALRRSTAERPTDHGTLEPLAKEWEERAQESFLNGYRKNIDGCASWPRDFIADRLIKLFVIEKALYELRYEIDNRPDWMAIPLSALLNLFAQEQD